MKVSLLTSKREPSFWESVFGGKLELAALGHSSGCRAAWFQELWHGASTFCVQAPFSAIKASSIRPSNTGQDPETDNQNEPLRDSFRRPPS